MARGERQRRLVRRRVRAVVPDRQVAHARHLEARERAGVVRGTRGRGGAIEVADAREDGVDRARLGADEVRVARLSVCLGVVSADYRVREKGERSQEGSLPGRSRTWEAGEGR